MTPIRLIHAALVVAAFAAAIPVGHAQVTWSDPTGLLYKGGNGGFLMVYDSDTLLLISGGNSTNFSKYTISTATWTPLAVLPLAPTAGSCSAFMPGSGFVYYLKNVATANFYRYSVASNTWSAASAIADFPVLSASGASMTATGSKIYVARGGSTTTGLEFYEYTPNAGTGSWLRIADAGTFFGSGGSIVYPGSGDFIYGLGGNNTLTTTDFVRYAITGVNPAGQAANTWNSMAFIPDSVGVGGCMAAGPAGFLYAMSGNSSPAMNRYDIGANTWSPLAGWSPALLGINESVPFTPSNGAGIAWPGAGDYVFLTKGGGAAATAGSSHFARYSISKDKFEPALPLTPDVVGTGGCMASAGNGDHLYLAGGLGAHPLNDALGFYRYSTVSSTWTRKADMPDWPADGSWMVAGGATYMFVAQGGSTDQFWRYAISAPNAAGQAADTWQVLSPSPFFNAGSAGVWTGGDFIYALTGGSSTTFYRYQISTDTWVSSVAASPALTNFGCSLSWDGLDHIYAFAGGVLATPTRTFQWYCLSRNQWNVRTDGTVLDPADCPVDVGRGSSLCYSATDTRVYAIAGTPTNTAAASPYFLTYLPSTDTWTQKSPLPASPGLGTTMALPSSSSVAFYAVAGGNTRLMWRFLAALATPTPPTGLGQFKLDGTTAIAQGSWTFEPGATFSATCTHPDAVPIKLQVEVVPQSASFTGNFTAESPFRPSGTAIALPVNGLAVAHYKWQARTVDGLAQGSAWNEFGAASVDFSVIDGSLGNSKVCAATPMGPLPALVGLVAIASLLALGRR